MLTDNKGADDTDMFVVIEHSCNEKETNDSQCEFWQKATQEENISPGEQQTLKLVSLPKQAHEVIDCRWVYRLKPRTSATEEKFNVGLIARGFQQ